ncbi:MAG: CapA family protein [Clostridiales bacterium]|nr:CapA family protein [Clostridiales bacterium]
MKKALGVILCAILFLDVISICLMAFLSGDDAEKTADVPGSVSDGLFSRVRITAAGDNLVTQAVYGSAGAGTESDYDFAPVYENAASVISSADIAVLNQLTLISTMHNISGTDIYNSPSQLGDEMVRLGFDLINMANNHMLDFGEAGLKSANDFWLGKGVKTIGVIEEESNPDYFTVCEVNGMRIAFVSVTSSMGSNTLPADSSLKVLLTSEESFIQQAIAAAESSAECTVVLAHWGERDSLLPSEETQTLAAKMGDWGADVIIGSGSGNLQSVEFIVNRDNSRTLVAYSLGNFVSSADSISQLLGGILSFDITRNNNTGDVIIEKIDLEGVVTHYGYEETGIRLYLLSEYTDETAKRHGVTVKDKDFNLTNLKSALQSCKNY